MSAAYQGPFGKNARVNFFAMAISPSVQSTIAAPLLNSHHSTTTPPRPPPKTFPLIPELYAIHRPVRQVSTFMSSRSSPAPDERHHSRSSTNQSSSSYFTYPVSYAVSGLLRRLNSESPSASSSGPTSGMSLSFPSLGSTNGTGTSGVYTPPRRQASPFQPPPLTPLTLTGYHESTPTSSRLMNRSLAEEIRLLFPPRLQLVENWQLAYSLEEHGVSLATLYQRCDEYRGKRGGYVLAVQDDEGAVSSSLGCERDLRSLTIFSTRFLVPI
jgi:hypothetical protein